MPTRDSKYNKEKASIPAAPLLPHLRPSHVCTRLCAIAIPGPREGRLERERATECWSLANLEQAAPRRPPAVCPRRFFSATAGSCCIGQRSPAEKCKKKLIKIRSVNFGERRIYILARGGRRSWPRTKCGEMIQSLCNLNKLTHCPSDDAKTVLFQYLKTS